MSQIQWFRSLDLILAWLVIVLSQVELIIAKYNVRLYVCVSHYLYYALYCYDMVLLLYDAYCINLVASEVLTVYGVW